MELVIFQSIQSKLWRWEIILHRSLQSLHIWASRATPFVLDNTSKMFVFGTTLGEKEDIFIWSKGQSGLLPIIRDLGSLAQSFYLEKQPTVCADIDLGPFILPPPIFWKHPCCRLTYYLVNRVKSQILHSFWQVTPFTNFFCELGAH